MSAKDKELLRLFDAGKSRKEISDEIKASYTWVCKRLKALRPDKPGRPATDKDDARIAALLAAGFGVAAIARDVNRTRTFVDYRVQTLELRRAPKPDEPQEPECDAWHVAACLAEGGFIYREVRGGRVVEVRP